MNQNEVEAMTGNNGRHMTTIHDCPIAQVTEYCDLAKRGEPLCLISESEAAAFPAGAWTLSAKRQS